MKALILALALLPGFAFANPAEIFHLDARSVLRDCPALTQCKIRCHNLSPGNDRKFIQCVRRNCTDPGVCVEE